MLSEVAIISELLSGVHVKRAYTRLAYTHLYVSVIQTHTPVRENVLTDGGDPG